MLKHSIDRLISLLIVCSNLINNLKQLSVSGGGYLIREGVFFFLKMESVFRYGLILKRKIK